MSKKLIGTFYFKRTLHGNIIGEFTNNDSSKIMTESATPKSSTIDFEGEYNSNWFDITTHSADLNIEKNGNKFKINWTELHNPSYEGEAILVDDLLVGYYRMNNS